MEDTTKRCIQDAADLINDGIYSYCADADDDGFMETVNILSRIIETQCHKCDREAHFANIRRKLLRSLADPSRRQRTTAHACFCLGYCNVDLDDE